jgi:uncharacterized DUF497 family protein
MIEFRWNEWNLEHATKHGISQQEAELVFRRARAPFPEQIGEEKLLSWAAAKGAVMCRSFIFLTTTALYTLFTPGH